MYYRVFALLSLCALPLAAMAGADAAPSHPSSGTPMALDGRVMVETANGDAGSPRTLREASEAHSGDRLIFLIRYRNTGHSALSGYELTSPVPQGVQILPDRAGTVRVSGDGGRSWSRPAGDLTPTDVRLRLDHAIAPGETGAVVYRGLLL